MKCDQEKPCKRCRTKGLECRVDSGASSSARTDDQVSPISQWASPPGQAQPTPPQARSVPAVHSQFQVPAPTVAYGLGTPMQPPTIPYANHNLHANHDPSLINFLSSVVHPTVPTQVHPQTTSHLNWAQNSQPRDLMDFSQDLSMDFSDLDTVLKGEWGGWLDPSLMPPAFDKPTDNSQLSDVSTPSIDDSINLGAAAYNRSAWRWIPNHERGNQDQSLASVLVDSHGPDGKLPRPRQIALIPPMEPQERDKIVALLLAGCDKANYQKIVALFPSTR